MPLIIKDPILGTELVVVKGCDFEVGDSFSDGWNGEHPVTLRLFWLSAPVGSQSEKQGYQQRAKVAMEPIIPGSNYT